MVVELAGWHVRFSSVHNCNIVLVHAYERDVVVAIFVPGYSQEWLLLLVENIEFLEVSDVEESGLAVSPNGCENIHLWAKTDVEGLFVVRYELLDLHLLLYVPDHTRRVDAGCANHLQFTRVSVEACQRCAQILLEVYQL